MGSSFRRLMGVAPDQLPGWLSGTRPDVVMMRLGTNDVWNNIPASSLLLTFSGLVGQMRASNPFMQVLVPDRWRTPGSAR
ncbi:MAG: mannan endo,4-beta-mannosidase [Actinomycetota bacterium]|nr:mannan endo,4-beta-mannosidase [Actinomycetota bacterium]